MSANSNFRSRVRRVGELTNSEFLAWDRLCVEENRRAFLSPHFALAVDRARGGVRVCIFERAGEPVAFFPFQFAGSGAALLRAGQPIGASMSDGFGVVARGDVQLSIDELLEASGLAVCEVHHLCAGPNGLTANESELGLRVRFDGGWVAYWESLAEQSKKFVQKTERRCRNIVKEHGPLRLTAIHADSKSVLEDLITRKREQYAATKAPDALRESWKRKLLFELLETQQASCRGTLFTLHAGDTWVATHFGLQCEDVLHYWFPVYSREVSKHSPGHLLLKAIGEQCEELGIGVVDRGAGDTQAKRSFANEEQSFGRGRWSRPSLRTTVYSAARSVGWRLEALRGKSKV